jgi:hypothetical protein
MSLRGVRHSAYSQLHNIGKICYLSAERRGNLLLTLTMHDFIIMGFFGPFNNRIRNNGSF